ncbi:hypothetical protein AB0E27_38670 [Streptomyces sparsogenes]|uniref:hypothetical protein n=1 Tax=Streptomyces sparsogenes TaxID=67365 RepID=UPI0033E03C00
MTPQHTTWSAADLETAQHLAAAQHLGDLPDAAAQRRLARCAGLWSAATDHRHQQAARHKRAARRALRVRRALHLAA